MSGFSNFHYLPTRKVHLLRNAFRGRVCQPTFVKFSYSITLAISQLISAVALCTALKHDDVSLMWIRQEGAFISLVLLKSLFHKNWQSPTSSMTLQMRIFFFSIIARCYEPRTRDIAGGQTLKRLVGSSVNPL